MSYLHTTTNVDRVQARRIKAKLYKFCAVKLTRQGGVKADIMHAQIKPKQGIKKLSRNYYYVLSTGEIREYKNTDIKQSDSLSKTFRALRQIINNNFFANKNELFLTLTYKENMQDAQKLYVDFKAFFKRLKYYTKKNIDYIAICEPQERGAWHVHALIKTNDKNFYISNLVMQKIWGHGYTETKRIDRNIDNLGRYFCAYFRNLEDAPESLMAGKKAAKKYKKGERLHLYPKHFRFFRTSRGIVKPQQEDAIYADVLAEYGDPIRDVAFELVDESGRVKNTIVMQEFNSTRRD